MNLRESQDGKTGQFSNKKAQQPSFS